MSERKRIFWLISIMAIVSLTVGGIAIFALYRTAIKEQNTRLVEAAQSQARLIEAVARFDAIYIKDFPEGPEKATLHQVIDAHKQYKGFGETGEFTLAKRQADKIIFLLSHRHHDLDNPHPVLLSSQQAEPMRRALSGLSGTVIGPDYRGEKVLAAHEPVQGLNLGIVAKIDMAEVRKPFAKSALLGLGVAILVVLAGAGLFMRISNPFIRDLEERVSERAAELTKSNLLLSQEAKQRKQAEARALALSQQLAKAQEIERQKISRDLHDGVAQDLAALKLGLDTLFDDQTEIDPIIRQRALEYSGRLRETVESIRNLAHQFGPSGIEEEGLINAVRRYCNDFSANYAVEVEFFSSGIEEKRIGIDIKSIIFRLIQECLNNVRKHAGANKVKVQLIELSSGITFSIEDDGRGFDTQEKLTRSVDKKHLGLRGIQEAVKVFLGRMEVDSQPGRGTRLVIWLPCFENGQ